MERILYKTHKLDKRTAAKAFALLEAQYREHEIEMGGARLKKAMLELVKPAKGALLITDDASGVAALTWQFSIERGGRVAWLEELYVLPARRGEGLGKLLIDAAAREARKAGCLSLELEVVRGHERAAKLYLREGFEELPRVRYSLALRHGRRAAAVAS
jgi:GNAT superfamily N-acetyltransferase